MTKLEINHRMCDRLLLLAAILTQWRRSVASSEALDLFHWAMRTVLYRRTAGPLKWPAKWVHALVVVLFAVTPAAAGAIQSK